MKALRPSAILGFHFLPFDVDTLLGVNSIGSITRTVAAMSSASNHGIINSGHAEFPRHND